MVMALIVLLKDGLGSHLFMIAIYSTFSVAVLLPWILQVTVTSRTSLGAAGTLYV